MVDHPGDHREGISREARNRLNKLGDSDNLFTGSLAAARRTAAHFSGRDDTADDATEIWGKRIGRALSLTGVAALGIYLYLTYVK
jgi:hypothetical protein